MRSEEPDDGFRHAEHGGIEVKCPTCGQWESMLFLEAYPLIATHRRRDIDGRYCPQPPYGIALPERFGPKKRKKWWARSK